MIKCGWIFDENSGERLFQVNSTTVLAEDSDGRVKIYLRVSPTFNKGNTVQFPDGKFALEERERNRAEVEAVKAENEAYFRAHPKETPSMSPKSSLYSFDYIRHWLREAYENDEARVAKIMNETFGAHPAL